jgi:hypothetical protein
MTPIRRSYPRVIRVRAVAGPANWAMSHVAFVGGNATFLIADTANNRIRRVGDDGAITTVAGSGPAAGAAGGFAGDSLASTNPTTRLNAPPGVSPAADSGFLIADSGNNGIRQLSDVPTTITPTPNQRPRSSPPSASRRRGSASAWSPGPSPATRSSACRDRAASAR